MSPNSKDSEEEEEEARPLIAGGDGTFSVNDTSRDVAKRWYILGLFFMLTANQCLFWFTFSSNPDAVTKFYPRVSTGVIDTLLNWGPLTFVPSVPFVSYLLERESGLQSTMRLAAVLSFSGCLIRLIPSFLPAESREHWASTIPLHIGQILNGIAGPVLIAGPSRLSAVWFPPLQRARVTAIANSSLFGAAIGFYLGPAAPSVTSLLLITLGLSVLPLILVFAYCPIKPRVPPSAAVVGQEQHNGLVSFFKGAGRVMGAEPTIMLLMVVTGLGVGIYDCWIGVLPQILDKISNVTETNQHRSQWDKNNNGLCGMAHTGACILGMWFSGAVADRVFRRRFKLLLILLFSIAALLFFWLICLLNGHEFSFADKVPRTTVIVFVVVSLVGFVRTAAVPILYEIAAEITYPHPEGTSAGMIVIAEHVTLLTMLFLSSSNVVGPMEVSTINLIGLGLCPLLLLLAKTSYKRMDAEHTCTKALKVTGVNY